MYLHDDGWTKAETDHLFDLCKRFDLRFIVVHDRYDHQQYRVRRLSMTDITHTHILNTEFESTNHNTEKKDSSISKHLEYLNVLHREI